MKRRHAGLLVSAVASLGLAAVAIAGVDPPLVARVDTQAVRITAGRDGATDQTPAPRPTPAPNPDPQPEPTPNPSPDPQPTSTTLAPQPGPYDPTVLLISDSAWLSIKNYSASDAVRGFTNELDLASCRRRRSTSCTNYTGQVPITLLDELELRSPGQFDTLVVATGYNDSDHNFDSDFRAIMSEARSIGITQTVWLTLREDVTYESPDMAGHAQVFRNNNETLRQLVASGEFPDVFIADWNTYAVDRSDWFARDGIHLSRTGAFAGADYVSRKIAALNGLACPAPNTIGGVIDEPCPDPDVASPTVDIPALYPTTRNEPGNVFCLDWQGSGSWPNAPWWLHPDPPPDDSAPCVEPG